LRLAALSFIASLPLKEPSERFLATGSQASDPERYGSMEFHQQALQSSTHSIFEHISSFDTIAASRCAAECTAPNRSMPTSTPEPDHAMLFLFTVWLYAG
jgi:hypothetical protein